jgi:hypothetical protein
VGAVGPLEIFDKFGQSPDHRASVAKRIRFSEVTGLKSSAKRTITAQIRVSLSSLIL